MIPAISQVCTLNAQTETEIEDYAAAHCRVLEAWWTKIETYLQHHPPERLREHLERHQVRLAAASLQGGLFGRIDPVRREAWELLDRRLELCRRLEIPLLVAVCDVGFPLEASDLGQTRARLGELAGRAEQRQVRIAVEFHARSAWPNNLQTLAAMLEEVASPWLGICLDVFHFFVGPSKLADLDCLTAANLFHVQLSDLADIPRELATDGDRILPGDGDFTLAPILDRLTEIGYTGCVSLELMNPRLWQVPPRQFGEIAMTALRKLLGQAAME